MAWGGEKQDSKKEPYIRVRRVPAGKFHRYAGWKFVDYFKRIDLTIKDLIFRNIMGFFSFVAGIITSFFRLLLKRNRPDRIFLKGGYVCLPVGLVARLFKIPYIIHESDVVPGLANRILMKKAEKVAFGVPVPDEVAKEHPNYIWTGVPVASEFKPVSMTKQASLKKAFSFSANKPLIVITGGSQGSAHLNEATRAILPELLKISSVGLVAGRSLYEDMIDLKQYENWDNASLESNFRMWEFNTTMHELMGAADVIVSRAGATTIAEMAALKKATILVPFGTLPGAHQTKNAERLEKLNAVKVIDDAKMYEKPELLLNMIRDLVKNPRKCADMADNLHKEARGDASKRLAEIILGD